MPILVDCYDRGRFFWGAFENDKLIGVSVLESKFIGSKYDTLQLKFLHVSRAYRDRGIGTELFIAAKTQAREHGAKRMYISATPSEHTIRFYMGVGCVVTPEPDAELLALEPEDIHLECNV
jgi:GNAT superfamily N-acetyltransferase